jgi:DNA-binding NtrC family response regulator
MHESPDELRPSGPVGRSGPLSGLHILIAEDEAIIALELQDILCDAGADVVSVTYTIEEALAAIDHADVSLGVLDVRLGPASIGPVAERLIGLGVPFLFYSGQPPTDPARAPWPHVPTLEKPASEAKLLSAVCDLLNHPSLA